MITIGQIDFSSLKPYDGKVTKCFEQLCYQLALKKYAHLGKFTPIDGSGGDSGVEFYLQLNNGETWGWQCKYFGDTGRLNFGNRKKQIKDSLETACRNHTALTKWILCLKTDLTADSLSPKGKQSRGEQYWFDTELPKKIPSGRSVELVHWGESHILTLLNSQNTLALEAFFSENLNLMRNGLEISLMKTLRKSKIKTTQNCTVLTDTINLLFFLLCSTQITAPYWNNSKKNYLKSQNK